MSNPGWISNILRNIFSFFDSLGFTIVSAIYNIFFTIANAEIFSGNIMNDFFKRVQLILGVFMIFNLAITALNIIINPDLLSDKQKGAGKIFMKIALSLVMLTLVVPMENIPKTSDLNRRISENGILFGFLYQFQDSVMQDNVIGKLVLASNVESNEGNYGNLDNMSNLGDMLATTVARAFITPALKDTSSDPVLNPSDLKDEDVLCPAILTIYGEPNISYKTLLDNINATCDSDTQGEVYMLEYHGLFALICTVIMAIIILGFTIDVAVRAIKLAILRLISPIPIISYIMPGQDKNGSFNNWVKTLTSTYMDLFLRLIIIYFGAYVIVIISEGGINIWQNSPGFFTSLFSSVFLIIGVLIFMKQAPKFFQDMLGLKGSGSLFSGIGTVLGAAALTGGLAGSIATGVRAGWAEGAEYKGRTAGVRRVFGAGMAGLTSGIGGLFTGARTLATTDKKVPSSVMSAMQKRNAIRASHSTLFGRAKSNLYGMATGRTLAEKDKAILDATQEASKEISAWASAAEEEALKQTDARTYYGVAEIGGRTYGFNWDQLQGAMSGADASGNFYINGNRFNRADFTPEKLNEIKKSQTARFVSSVYNSATGTFTNARLQTSWRMLEPKLKNAGFDYSDLYAIQYDPDTGAPALDAEGHNITLPILDPTKKGAALGKASSTIADYTNSMKHIKHIANHNNSRS